MRQQKGVDKTDLKKLLQTNPLTILQEAAIDF